MDLWDAIGVHRGAVVSVIGAGGKTSTVLALAWQAADRDLDVLVTTTTRMWLPDLPVVYSDSAADLDRALKPAFREHRVVAAGTGSRDGKLLGLAPAAFSSLTSAGVILCEADGAAGRSLKIHRAGEPVVPACSTHLVVVAGLDALGLPFCDSAHPAPLAAEYFGEALEARIREQHVAGALLEGATFLPPSASLAFLLNKIEGPDRIEAARRISQHLGRDAPGSVVLLVSHGRVLDTAGGTTGSPSYTRP